MPASSLGAMLENRTINAPNGHTRDMVDGGVWLRYDLGDFDFASQL